MHPQQVRTEADPRDRAREKGRAKSTFHKTVAYVSMRLQLSFPARALLRELVDSSYEHPRGWYSRVSNRSLTFALGYRRDSSVRRVLTAVEAVTAGLIERQSGKGKGRRSANVDTLYIFDAAAWDDRERTEREKQRREIAESEPAGSDSGFGWARCALTPERASALTPERASALTPERASALTPERASALTIQEAEAGRVRTGTDQGRQQGGGPDDPSAPGPACLPSDPDPDRRAKARAALDHYGVEEPALTIILDAVPTLTEREVATEALQIKLRMQTGGAKKPRDLTAVLIGTLRRRYSIAQLGKGGHIGGPLAEANEYLHRLRRENIARCAQERGDP